MQASADADDAKMAKASHDVTSLLSVCDSEDDDDDAGIRTPDPAQVRVHAHWQQPLLLAALASANARKTPCPTPAPAPDTDHALAELPCCPTLTCVHAATTKQGSSGSGATDSVNNSGGSEEPHEQASERRVCPFENSREISLVGAQTGGGGGVCWGGASPPSQQSKTVHVVVDHRRCAPPFIVA